MWCPQCGDEFRDGFVRCSYCAQDLVAIRPAPAVPAPRTDPEQHEDHVLLEYDLSDWTEDERHALDLRLRMSAIPAGWEDGDGLVVGRAWQAEVDELVEAVDDTMGARTDAAADDTMSYAVSGLASPGRRILGALIDFTVLAGASAAMRGALPGDIGNALVFGLSIGYWIVPVARWGRTVGKLVVRTRIMRIDGVDPPGWRVAAVRWLVEVGPAILVVFSDLLSRRTLLIVVFVSYVWSVFIYVPILGPTRRGIHDRIAGTEVVRA